MVVQRRHLIVIAGDILLLVLCLLHVPALRDKARMPFAVRTEGTVVIVDRIREAAASPTLVPGDVVTSLRNVPIASDHDMELMEDRFLVGDTLSVAVSRGGESFSALCTLVPGYSTLYIIITLCVGLITWGLGLSVFLARPGDRAAVVLHWAMMCMAVSTILMWGNVSTSALESIVNRTVFFAAYMGVGTCLLHFTMIFPEARRPVTQRRLALVYGPGIVLALGLIACYWISYASRSVQSYAYFRTLYDVFHAILLLYVAISVRNFVASFRLASGTAGRKKLQWILFGLTIGPLPFLLLIVLPELFISVSPVPEEYTVVFFIFIPLSFAVSIIRYHTFDIEFVINRTTVYAIAVGALSIVYVGLVTSLATVFASLSVPVAAGGAALIALLFEPFRKRVQRFVDRRFFRTRYDFRKSERMLLEKISKSYSAQQIANLLVGELQRLIQCEGICFFAKGPEGAFRRIASIHYGAAISPGLEETLVSLPPVRIPVARPGAVEDGVAPLSTTLSAVDGTALIVPLPSDEQTLVGAIALREKKSREKFTDEDLDLLANVAGRAGTAITSIHLHHDLLVREIEAERLKELSSMKSDLVSYVSHEFRTPLTSIKLFTELLEPMTADQSREGKEYLRVIAGETDRLNRMVGNLLDTARIERGVKTYTFRMVDTCKIVRDVAETLRYQLDKDGFVLRIIGARRPMIIEADQDAAHEAVENLLVNAMKYSGESRKIEIRLSRSDGHVAIAVRDYGVGIPADQQKHLFEKYFRASSTRKSVRGIGLGLSLVGSIMAAHHGRVTVKSEPGRGSEFTLVFPAASREKGSYEDHPDR